MVDLQSRGLIVIVRTLTSSLNASVHCTAAVHAVCPYDDSQQQRRSRASWRTIPIPLIPAKAAHKERARIRLVQRIHPLLSSEFASNQTSPAWGRYRGRTYAPKSSSSSVTPVATTHHRRTNPYSAFRPNGGSSHRYESHNVKITGFLSPPGKIQDLFAKSGE